MSLAIFRFPYDVVRLLLVDWLNLADCTNLDSVFRVSKILRHDYLSFLELFEIGYWHIPKIDRIEHYKTINEWLMKRNLILRNLSCDVSLLLTKHFNSSSLHHIQNITVQNISLKDAEKLLAFVSSSNYQPLKSLQSLSLKGCTLSHNRPIVDDWYIARFVCGSKSLKELKLERVYVELSSSSSFAAALLDSVPKLTSLSLSDVSDELFISLFITYPLPLLEKVKILSRLYRSSSTVSTISMENHFQRAKHCLPNLRSISAHSQLVYCLSCLSSNQRFALSEQPASDIHIYVSLHPLQLKQNASPSYSDDMLQRFLGHVKFTAEIFSRKLSSLSINIFYEESTVTTAQLLENDHIDDCRSKDNFEFDQRVKYPGVYNCIEYLQSLKLTLTQLAIGGSTNTNSFDDFPAYVTSKHFIWDIPQYLKHLRNLDLSIQEPVFRNDLHSNCLRFIEQFNEWTYCLVNECKLLNTVRLCNIPVNVIELGNLSKLRTLTIEMNSAQLFEFWYEAFHISFHDNINRREGNRTESIFVSLYQFCWKSNNLSNNNNKQKEEKIFQLIMQNAQRLRNMIVNCSTGKIPIERKSFQKFSSIEQECLSQYLSIFFIEFISEWMHSGEKSRFFAFL